MKRLNNHDMMHNFRRVEVGSCMRQHSKTPHYLTGICGVREVVCRVRQTAGRVCLTGQKRLCARSDIICPARHCLPGQRGCLPGETMSPG